MFFLTVTLTVAACGQSNENSSPQNSDKNAKTVSMPTNTDVITEIIEGKEFSLKNNGGR